MYLFDFDGTLVDSNGVWVEIDNGFLARRGLTPTREYSDTVGHSIFPIAAIKKAEGEAEAILKVQQATAEAIKLLNEADPREAVLRIKALEAFQAAADGKATKIIIPSEIQGLAGLCASAKAVFDSVEPNKPKPPAESK